MHAAIENSGKDEIQLPKGFRAAGVRAGIKKRELLDLALIVSDPIATVAGVFTTNQVSAAPVKLCRERLIGGSAAAVIVNSGNANACTGSEGLADARQMTAWTAAALAVEEAQVFVCSTGHIGARLPMDVIESGIPDAVAALSVDGGKLAAEAIMTTDIRIKHWTVRLEVNGAPVIVSGIAKGAGMIEPNMATMLSFLMTDAAVAPEALQTALTNAVNQSFNRITVDGDQSTNDTVLLLANGAAEHGDPLQPDHPDWSAFQAALQEVTLELALKIVQDGEGANKQVTITVAGAQRDADADRIARAIANSFLVKTSWAGAYPNWGRVMDAIGYARAPVQEDRIDIWYDEHHAVHGGLFTGIDLDVLRKVILQPAFHLRIDLHLGEGAAVVYTCEITEEYVRINVV